MLTHIVALRDMGFSIDEIGDILPNFDNKACMDSVLHEKMGAIQPAMDVKYDVVLKEIPAVKVLSLREVLLSYDQKGTLWERMGGLMAKHGVVCPETECAGYSIYHDDDHKEADVGVEIAVPVDVLGKGEDGLVYKEHTVVVLNNNGNQITSRRDRTKSKSSRRTLPLIPVVKEMLLKIQKEQAYYRSICGNCYNEKDSAYVYTDPLGNLIKPDRLTNELPKFLEKNGFRRIRFHDLRHSCASLLLANGVSLKEVQEWLGHSDFAITANIYGHLDYQAKVRIASITVVNPSNSFSNDATWQ